MGVCSIKVILLVTGVMALALAYHLYIPLPDWVEQPWLLRYHMIFFKAINLAAYITSSLTSVTQIQALQAITDAVYYDSSLFSDQAVEIRDVKFDGVPVRIFHPRAARSASPAIVYFHGIGWLSNSHNVYNQVIHYMAKTYNIVMVSVEYRLGPYPLPFDDCVKATLHLLHNGEKYDINPMRIGVAGDGTGGNLAAAVSLRLSKEDPKQTPHLKLQVLFYPALQAIDFNTYSYQTYDKTGYLSKEIMINLWLSYFGSPDLMKRIDEFAANNHTSRLLKKSQYAAYIKHENLPEEFRSSEFRSIGENGGNDTLSGSIETVLLDPFFAPLMAEELSLVPPAFIITAENDVLRDDGIFYAERLKKAGVSTVLSHFTTMHHGFCVLGPVDMLNFPTCYKALDALGKHVRENL